MGEKGNTPLNQAIGGGESDWTERRRWESRAHCGNWFSYSLRHFHSMVHHLKEMKKYDRDRVTGEEGSRIHTLYFTHQENANHFFGLAVENLLKGVLIAKSGGMVLLESKDDKETYGIFQFPWNDWKKKHDLPKLARYADIGLTKKEIISLDWCTDFITWKYRYPVPQTHFDRFRAPLRIIRRMK